MIAVTAILVGITAALAVPPAVRADRRRLLEVAGHVEVVLVDEGAADLGVVTLLARACEGVAAPLAHRAEVAVEHGADAALELDFLRRLAADEVDGTAEAARSVEHRDVALLHLNLGDDPAVRKRSKSRRLSAGRYMRTPSM